MGGAQQPQAHVQVLLNILLFGMDPQQALDAARFNHAARRSVGFESPIPSADVITALVAMGHERLDTSTSLGGLPVFFGGGQADHESRAGLDCRLRAAEGRIGSRVLMSSRVRCVAALLLGAAPNAAAQFTRTPATLEQFFEPKLEVMIPMRDGIRLHTEIYLPRNAPPGPRPILLERTPYYANPGERNHSSRLGFYTEFFPDGYIFVLQDLRGRFLSEGQHVTLRPQRKPGDPAGFDESTDYYDTIEWLVKNVPEPQWTGGDAGNFATAGS